MINQPRLASVLKIPGRVLRQGIVASLLASVFSLLHNANAYAAQTAVALCSSCASVSDLQAAAGAFFSSGAGSEGAIVFMISEIEPIAMFFDKDCPNGLMYPCVGLLPSQYATGNVTANALALDNAIHSRAAKIAAVKTPTNIPYTEPDETIVQYLQTQLVPTGQFGINAWHLLTGAPSVEWFTITDIQTGQTDTVYVGDVITVNYPGGYSEKWQFLGAHTTIQWKRVPNTLMKNGVPVVAPSTAPATPIPGAASGQGTNGNLTLTSLVNGWICYGISSVTVELDGTSITGYGSYAFPCDGN